MWLKTQLQGHHLHLSWGDRNGPYPLNYSVGVESLRNASRAIHEQLSRIAVWSLEGAPGELPGLLRELAELGSNLRFLLFDPDPAVHGVMELEQWIREAYANDRQLAITADPDLHIPWGLVFDGDVDAIGAASDGPADYGDFWCQKYGFSIVLSGSDPPTWKLTRPRSSHRMLSILHESVYEAAVQVAPRMKHFVGLPVGSAYDVRGAQQRVRQAAGSDALLFFFGHGDNGELLLSGNERINSLTFKKMLFELTQRVHGRPATFSLLFLNACESMFGALDASIRSAAARSGICGLIATEAKVPAGFAARFACRFLECLLEEGLTVGETMAELHKSKEWWPLSLLYGCYAHINYRIEKPQGEAA